MTINDLQNVTYETVGNPAIGYRITAVDGYCIHTPQHEENEYATVILVPVSYDLSQIQVLPISELPEGAEIHGGETEPDTETM